MEITIGQLKKFCYLLISLLFFTGCADDNVTIHNKLTLLSKIYHTNKFYWEVYPVENLHTDDMLNVNQVSKFVLENYSSQISKSHKLYRISFYNYDSSNNNGISSTLKLEKDLIEWRSDSLKLEYDWQDGIFLGVTIYDSEGLMVSAYTPVDGFENL